MYDAHRVWLIGREGSWVYFKKSGYREGRGLGFVSKRQGIERRRVPGLF